MTKESNTPEERRDVDLALVQDARTDELQKLRAHLQRPILAKEANGAVPLHSGALRRHADLDSAKEHPYRRLVREHREAKKP